MLADETLAVDLSEGFEALRRRWTRGHRSGARKAERLGVTIRLATTPGDWLSYADVTRDSVRRWGADRVLLPHPDGLLQALATHGGRHVQLWLAEHEGRVVAGALCLHSPRLVSYWHGAAREEAFPLRPVIKSRRWTYPFSVILFRRANVQ